MWPLGQVFLLSREHNWQTLLQAACDSTFENLSFT
jgi:hypothetical protein